MKTIGTHWMPVAVTTCATLLFACILVGCTGGDSVRYGAGGDTSGPTGDNRPASCPVSPEYASRDADTSLLLTWSAMMPQYGAVTYTVLFDTTYPPVNVLAGRTSDTSYTMSGLGFGTRYFWRVLTNWSDGTDSCRYWYFCTRFRQMRTVDSSTSTLRSSGMLSIALDADGAVWAGSSSDGVLRIPADGAVVTHSATTGSDARIIGRLADGTLCISSATGTYKVGGATVSPQVVSRIVGTKGTSTYPFVDMVTIAGGETWFAAGDGPRRWNGVDTSRVYANELGTATVRAIAATTHKLDTSSILGLVAGTSQGLRTLRSKRNESIKTLYDTLWLDADSVRALSLPDSTIDSVAGATDANKFYRTVDITSSKDTTVTYDTTWIVPSFVPAGLRSTAVTELATDAQGRLWLGTDRGDLQVFDGSTWLAQSPALEDYPVTAIRFSASDGSVWVAQNGGGVSRFLSQGGRKAYRVDNSPLISSYVTDLTLGADGIIWISSRDGAFMFQP